MYRYVWFVVLAHAAACNRTTPNPMSLPSDAVAMTDTRVTTDGSAALDYCPTRIDVFGYSNVMFSGCGGGAPTPGADAAGLFAPGTPGYDATLAGRLQARLAADPELRARFGTEWHVRSCASGGAVLGTLSSVDPDNGAACSPDAAHFVDMCTTDPAPVVLFSANNVYDHCHGGTSDSIPDSEATYAAHWESRFDDFVNARAPRLLLVSPQHEWHGEQGGAVSRPATCAWKLPGWNRTGLERWRSDHPAATQVIDAGDLQAEFQHHHPCCSQLGLTCEENWFEGDDSDGWVHFGCVGADALETMWFDALRAQLLQHDFTCPGVNTNVTMSGDGVSGRSVWEPRDRAATFPWGDG